MTRGRKAHADPPVKYVISVPSTLSAKVELLLFDPVTQKPLYGGRSALITQLLREWVERQVRVQESSGRGLHSGKESAILKS